MIISHRCHLVLFFDPLEPCQWLQQALAPWADQPVAPGNHGTRQTPFHQDMTPAEARTAFTRAGLDFDSYTRIAVVQNPFRKLAGLYDRTRRTDPIWRIKSRAGWQVPDFRSWLISGQYGCSGPLARLAPRWRRFGALSTKTWAAGQINSFVRAEFAASDLRIAMRQLDVVPAVDLVAKQKTHRFPELLRYDSETLAIVRRRFGADLRLYGGLGAGLDLVA